MSTKSPSDGLTFQNGIKDGLPIALGYISVSFAFGILSIEKGFAPWVPMMISLTNFTGTGQFIGMGLMAEMATYLEIAFTLLIINLRYVLMSLSLSQKLDCGVNLPQRLLIAFGITDENFVVAMGKPREVTFKYLMGLILTSFLGWLAGTFLGVVASGALPPAVSSALGITIYAMFIAIIVPPASTSKPVLLVVLIALVMSSAFKWLPLLNNISSGWVMIICGIVSSAIGAYLFPVNEEKEDVQ